MEFWEIIFVAVVAGTPFAFAGSVAAAEKNSSRKGSAKSSLHADLLLAVHEVVSSLLCRCDELDTVMGDVLERIGTAAGVDFVAIRALPVVQSEQETGASLQYGWARPPLRGSSLKVHSKEIFSVGTDGLKALRQGLCLHTRRQDSLSVDAVSIAHQDLASRFVVPIIIHSRLWGVLCLESGQLEKNWNHEEEAALRTLATLTGGAIEQWRMRQALVESETRFRDLSLATGEIIWETDASGCFTYISERVQAVTGYAVADLLGTKWKQLAYDPTNEDIVDVMFRVCSTEGHFRGLTHAIADKAGLCLWLSSSGQLQIGSSGVTGIRGTSLDITAERQVKLNLRDSLDALEKTNAELQEAVLQASRLSEKAKEANKAKSVFIASMSHELRTPLNTIIGMGHLLQSSTQNTRQLEYAQKIQEAASHLLGVVSSILDFSAIESSNVELVQSTFAWEPFCRSLLEHFTPEAEKKNLFFAWRSAPDIPAFLSGDMLRLKQILTYLIENAFKFTSVGNVLVSCSLGEVSQPGNVVMYISIADSGIGIDRGRQSELFTPFTQLDATATRKFGGTGLGLTITKRLVELFDGEFELLSEIGQGTEIRLKLPFGDVAPRGAFVPACKGLRVAVVMSSGPARDLCLQMVRDAGCEALAYASLEEIVAVFNTRGDNRVFDALILSKTEAEKVGYYALQELCLGNSLQKKLVAIVLHHSWDMIPQPVFSMLGSLVPYQLPLYSETLHRVLRQLDTFATDQTHGSGADKIPHFSGVRALVVDDTEINSQIVQAFLEETGISPFFAANGREALDLCAKSDRFDIIFMDLEMPVMDGFSAAEQIKQQPDWSDVPIVALTAHTTEQEKARCVKAGMDDCLTKPLDSAIFYSVLTRWIVPEKHVAYRAAVSVCENKEFWPVGLAFDSALKRLRDDRGLYASLLRRFVEYHSDSGSMLLLAISQGNVAEAMRLAHTVKGLAATIGARELQLASSTLEEQLGHCNADAGQSALVWSFVSELEGVIKSIAKWSQEQDRVNNTPQTFDPCELRRHCIALVRLLKDDDSAACDVFEKIAPLLRDVDAAAAYSMRQFMDLFAFDEALGVLEPILAKIEEMCKQASG